MTNTTQPISDEALAELDADVKIRYDAADADAQPGDQRYRILFRDYRALRERLRVAEEERRTALDAFAEMQANCYRMLRELEAAELGGVMTPKLNLLMMQYQYAITSAGLASLQGDMEKAEFYMKAAQIELISYAREMERQEAI